jgi:hypothetical protein
MNPEKSKLLVFCTGPDAPTYFTIVSAGIQPSRKISKQCDLKQI